MDTEQKTVPSRKVENRLEHRSSEEAPRGNAKEKKQATPRAGAPRGNQLPKTSTEFYQLVACHSNFISDFSIL